MRCSLKNSKDPTLWCLKLRYCLIKFWKWTFLLLNTLTGLASRLAWPAWSIWPMIIMTGVNITCMSCITSVSYLTYIIYMVWCYCKTYVIVQCITIIDYELHNPYQLSKHLDIFVGCSYCPQILDVSYTNLKLMLKGPTKSV